jgi:hypothetical protein
MVMVKGLDRLDRMKRGGKQQGGDQAGKQTGSKGAHRTLAKQGTQPHDDKPVGPGCKQGLGLSLAARAKGPSTQKAVAPASRDC